MKRQLSISIDEVAYNTCLKGRRNISAYIEDLLRSQYTEDNKTQIAKSVAKQVLADDDFAYEIKQIVERYMEDRRQY
jgi:hypothetical protein